MRLSLLRRRLLRLLQVPGPAEGAHGVHWHGVGGWRCAWCRRAGPDERCNPRWLGLCPRINDRQAPGQLSKALCKAHVLCIKLRACLADDQLEACYRLRCLELALLPQSLSFAAEAR